VQVITFVQTCNDTALKSRNYAYTCPLWASLSSKKLIKANSLLCQNGDQKPQKNGANLKSQMSRKIKTKTMKRLILASFALMLFVGINYGQSYTNTKSPTNSDFIPYSPDIKLVLDTIDLKNFIGEWKSLDDSKSLLIYQKGLEFLLEGDYFPGVKEYGDIARLSFTGRLAYVMNQGKRVQINSSQKGATVGYQVSITIFYENSNTHGGGGSSVSVAYSPVKDHLIIGKPPYNTFENGHWIGHGSTSASNGIYGKEFKRIQ